MNIRQKLVILFLVISFAPIALIGFLAYNTIKNEITSKSLNQLATLAASQEGKLNAILQRNREKIINLANNYQLRMSLNNFLKQKSPDDQEVLNKTLKETVLGSPEISAISLSDFEGKIIASTEKEAIGESISEEEYFLKGKKTDSIILAEDKKEEISRLYFTYKVTLEGKQLGILIMIFETDEVLNLIKNYTGLGTTGETELAEQDENGNGIFIAPLRFDSEAAFKRIVEARQSKQPIILSLNKTESIYIDTIDYRHQPVLAATRFIDLTSWGLVVKMDKNEAFASIYKLRNTLLIIVLATAVIIFALAFYLAKFITNPIVTLTKITQKIAEGDLSQKINITSKDEIGLLASSFNKMTVQLSQSYRSLEEKIKERTAELEEAGKKLEIVNLELQKKLEELERTNKLMVGRELKMAEMKKEIEELKKKVQ